MPAGPVRTRETASDGYHQALPATAEGTRTADTLLVKAHLPS
ncbi:hypothetical protein O1M63_18455 [Streptomyces mirabilis]|nr:hypothetical protein [Streptomyces mirabilis]